MLLWYLSKTFHHCHSTSSSLFWENSAFSAFSGSSTITYISKQTQTWCTPHIIKLPCRFMLVLWNLFSIPFGTLHCSSFSKRLNVYYTVLWPLWDVCPSLFSLWLLISYQRQWIQNISTFTFSRFIVTWFSKWNVNERSPALRRYIIDFLPIFLISTYLCTPSLYCRSSFMHKLCLQSVLYQGVNSFIDQQS